MFMQNNASIQSQKIEALILKNEYESHEVICVQSWFEINWKSLNSTEEESLQSLFESKFAKE